MASAYVPERLFVCEYLAGVAPTLRLPHELAALKAWVGWEKA